MWAEAERRRANREEWRRKRQENNERMRAGRNEGKKKKNARENDKNDRSHAWNGQETRSYPQGKDFNRRKNNAKCKL